MSAHLRIEWSESDRCLRNITESAPGVISIANGADEVYFYADPHLDLSGPKGMRERFGEEHEAPEKLGTPEEVFTACEPGEALRLYGMVAQAFAHTVKLALAEDHVMMIGPGYTFLVECRAALAGVLPPPE